MEVLISMGILLFGLLAVAALIPIGKLSMRETDKSDRTGACGRAAVHDLRVRKMLDTTTWTANPGGVVVIDPLGVSNGWTANLGGKTAGPPRISLNTITSSTIADQVFRWHDDLEIHSARGNDLGSPARRHSPPGDLVRGKRQRTVRRQLLLVSHSRPAARRTGAVRRIGGGVLSAQHLGGG